MRADILYLPVIFLLTCFARYFNKATHGARISKSSPKGTIRYILDGTKVIGEICSDGSPFYYHYDADSLCGVSIGNGVTDRESHFYTVMCDSEKSVRKVFYRGMLLASIDYDTFGNFKITKNPAITSGTINYTGFYKEFFEVTSIRWKGYIYDSETGFYYIDGRYYDPETGRFINAALSAEGIVNAANDVFGNNTFLLSGNSFRMADGNSMDCSPYYETEPSTDSKAAGSAAFRSAGSDSTKRSGSLVSGSTGSTVSEQVDATSARSTDSAAAESGSRRRGSADFFAPDFEATFI